MKRWALVVIATAAISGCTERQVLQSPPIGRPVALILDGAHNGDPDFFFLPPLVGSPVNDPHFDAGKFDATLTPTVWTNLLRRAPVRAGQRAPRLEQPVVSVQLGHEVPPASRPDQVLPDPGAGRVRQECPGVPRCGPRRPGHQEPPDGRCGAVSGWPDASHQVSD